MHDRHYTPAEANELLPVVRGVVRRLQTAQRELTEQDFDAGFAALAEVAGGAWAGRERAEAVVAVATGFAQLEALDIVVRDLDAGLVDFPSLREGEEVYLCWHVDEPAVGHWHAVEAGYAGRLPLD